MSAETVRPAELAGAAEKAVLPPQPGVACAAYNNDSAEMLGRLERRRLDGLYSFVPLLVM